jgi:hypothetical protein
METTHAWFSSVTALREGSSVYRKPDGSTVNVTRTNPQKDAKAPAGGEEQYLGEVVRTEDGGRVRETSRVRGIGPGDVADPRAKF